MTKHRSMDVVHRQALFDAMENAKEIATFAGLSPISDEVAAMERKDSLKRLLRIKKLVAPTEDHAAFLGAVFVAIQRESAKEEGIDPGDDMWIAAYETMKAMLNTTCMSMMSLYIDLGIVHLDPEWENTPEQGAADE